MFKKKFEKYFFLWKVIDNYEKNVIFANYKKNKKTKRWLFTI